MKPVHAVMFQQKKMIIGWDNDQNENFEMEILIEGEIDKALIIPEDIWR